MLAASRRPLLLFLSALLTSVASILLTASLFGNGKTRTYIPFRRSPSWYLDPSLAPDPLLYEPRKRARKSRILFFAAYEDALVRMDTFYYESFEAAKQHPYIEAVDFWGPGYKGYDDAKTWDENISQRYGCGYWDMLYTHYGLARIWDEKDPIATLSCGTLLVVSGGDCGYRQCPADSYFLHGNITTVRYAHELVELYSYADIVKVQKKKTLSRGLNGPFRYHLMAHVPDTANEWDFYPPARWSDKKYDAMLMGKAWREYYPLRSTVARAVEDGTTFIRQLERGPEFDLKSPLLANALKNPPASLDWNDPLHDTQRAILAHFAQVMRDTKICVFDGSVESKAIRKYAQSMLSGCVVAGDLPSDHDWMLQDNMISLPLYSSIEDINAAITAALADERELQRKAATSLRYARQHLTNLRALDIILDVVERYRAGERGYTFPTGFTARCRHYSSGDDPLVPAWCTGEDFIADQPGWTARAPY